MPRAQRADTQVMPSRGARLPGLAALVLHGHGAVALQGDDGEGTTEAPQLSSEQRQLQEAAATPHAKRGSYEHVVPQRQRDFGDEAMYTCTCQIWREAVIE
eukprot:COSAG01_NODE_11166_length_1991_cov_3.449260_3_plen_100_part_01